MLTGGPARARGPRRRRAASATARTWPASTCAFQEPPGRTDDATWNWRTPGTHQPGHVLAAQAAAGHQQAGHGGVRGGPVGQLVVAGRQPARRARPRAPRRARAARARCRQARSVSREASMARWKVQGTPGSASARCAQTSTSTCRSVSRKPKTTPFGADGEVVLAEPDQAGQLAAGGGVGVVEPQQHPHRQVGLLADRRRPAPAPADGPPAPTPVDTADRSAPPSSAPATSRGCSTTTSSSGAAGAGPGLVDPCSQWTS